MTKRYHKRHSKGGGFFDSIKQSFNSLGCLLRYYKNF